MTLGTRYDELLTRVTKAEEAEEYGVGGDKVRRNLQELYKELSRVESMIAMHGRDYDPANPPLPQRGKREVSFV